MARYPGAVWKPITAKKPVRVLSTHNRVNLHSTASSADSQHGYFNQPWQYDSAGNVTRFIPDSHFHVAYDGTVEQYKDTGIQAFADGEGNDATVSIETAGVASNGNEKWTAAQVAAIIKLVVWIMKTHDIRPQLASTSKSGSTSSQGLSWHRLGIDGNFPELPNIQAGRIQRGGGMYYSSSKGKICPGYGRVTQIHEDVWPAVKAALNQEEDMALTNDDKAAIRTIIREEVARALEDVQIDVPSNLVPYLGASASRDSIIRTGAARAEMARVAASE
jgi:hypothetical protein